MKGKKSSHTNILSTKRQKRISRQIRIDINVHRKIKIIAARDKKTISALAEEAIKGYFPEVKRKRFIFDLK